MFSVRLAEECLEFPIDERSTDPREEERYRKCCGDTFARKARLNGTLRCAVTKNEKKKKNQKEKHTKDAREKVRFTRERIKKKRYNRCVLEERK